MRRVLLLKYDLSNMCMSSPVAVGSPSQPQTSSAILSGREYTEVGMWKDISGL